MLRTIIVDDEQNSRELLRIALTKYVDDVQVVGEAEDVLSAINLIHSKKPDLVLLDIELHDDTGFDVLDKCENIDFSVIFVTAYDHYAIKAIRYSAIDYLLKPLDIDDLKESIERVKVKSFNQKDNIKFLKEQIKTPKEADERIIIPTANGYRLIEFNELLAIKAETGYSYFYLVGGARKLVAKPINYYEDLLPDNLFFRIHKSHIINLKKVKSFDAGRTGKVYLIDGSEMDIAARRKGKFVKMLQEQ